MNLLSGKRKGGELYNFEFKSAHKIEFRQAESKRIMEKYKDRIPIICDTTNQADIRMDKKKYLVPGNLTVGQFLYVVRKRISWTPEKALYIFTSNNKMPPTSATLERVYAENKDEDGFLYFKIMTESTFGGAIY